MNKINLIIIQRSKKIFQKRTSDCLPCRGHRLKPTELQTESRDLTNFLMCVVTDLCFGFNGLFPPSTFFYGNLMKLQVRPSVSTAYPKMANFLYNVIWPKGCRRLILPWLNFTEMFNDKV